MERKIGAAGSASDDRRKLRSSATVASREYCIGRGEEHLTPVRELLARRLGRAAQARLLLDRVQRAGLTALPSRSG